MKKITILTLAFCFITNLNAGEIYINRVKLNNNEISAMQLAYGYIENGRYWYDSLAGLWGYENGPTQGKAIPNVYFRGKLPANISGRGTDIYINNREIHNKEKQYLESIYGVGNVKTGRYWLNHLGAGGYEGGVAFFKIPHLQGKNKKRISPFSTRDLVGGSVVGNGYIGSDGTSATW